MQSLLYVKASDGAANASLMTVTTLRSPGATTILTNTVSNAPVYFYGSMGTPHTFTDPVTGETITVISEATAKDFAGQIVSGHVEIIAMAPGYTDAGSAVGDIIIIRPVTEWANNIFNVLNQAHQDNGALKTTSLDAFFKPSEVSPRNFIVSGATLALSSGLIGTLSDIVYYINGLRYTKTSIPNKTYTASKDTYVDIDITGTVTYTEAANGGANPALAANSIRLGRVITNGSAITQISQNVPDANGVWMAPNRPNYADLDTGWITPSTALPGGTALVTGFTGSFQYRLKGGILYFRGSTQRTAGAYPASYTTIVTLPFGFRIPFMTRLSVASYQGTTTAMLLAVVSNDGTIQIAPQGTAGYDTVYFAHALPVD